MPPTQTQYRIGSSGVLYLIVSGVILAAAIYTQANLLFWGFGLMVGGLVLSILAGAIALRGLRVTRVVPTHVAAGEALPLRYEVENRGWVPVFAVVLRENWGRGSRGWRKTGPAVGMGNTLGGPPHGWVLHVGPRQSVQTSAPCRPRQRGPLRFERVEASTSFPFGVIHKTLIYHQAHEVLVFPHLYRVRRALMNNLTGGNSDGQHTIQRAGGNEEFFGLREYRPGDSLRMIDWKRTARANKLVARELTQPSPPRISLVLDLREPPPMGAGGKRSDESEHDEPAISARQLEERAISLAASMVCDAYLQGFRVGLRILGPGANAFRPRHSLPHRTRLLEALAKLDLSDREPGAASQTDLSRVDVIIWAGRGSAIPMRPGSGTSPGATGRSAAATVIGAADFDRYVTNPAALEELSVIERRSPQAPRRLGSMPPVAPPQSAAEPAGAER